MHCHLLILCITTELALWAESSSLSTIFVFSIFFIFLLRINIYIYYGRTETGNRNFFRPDDDILKRLEVRVSQCNLVISEAVMCYGMMGVT